MRNASWIVVLGIGLCAALGATPAVALPLGVEFDTGNGGNFADVEISKVGNDLFFTITTNVAPNTDLGSGADLQDFYFNLTGGFTGASISSTDSQHANGQYELSPSPSVKGAAGSSFDFGVNFGNGAGAPGNGTLQLATFTLMADQELFLSSLAELSSTNNAGDVNFAAHFQGTSWAGDLMADSETVGGVIPEPATALLLAFGLVGLGQAGRVRPQR